MVLQFQGMIAEYERAQILERSRRGKRHRARQGQVSVLSGAPYGYRYHKKSEERAAYYQIIAAEAAVVREVYAFYTTDHMSIGAVTRALNERKVPTRNGVLRAGSVRRSGGYCETRHTWERPVSARPGERSGSGSRARCACVAGLRTATAPNTERPREDWIEIPVPAIVSAETFALAAERLEKNKTHAPRRTITPSVVQGLVSCRKCGYALSRTSTRTSARKIHYYRCLGSDAWRHLNGPVCDNRPVRQDLLDEIVWHEILRLLADPALVQNEIDRRLEAARAADPNQQRAQDLDRRLAHIRSSIDRLVSAYQEALITIDELRERMPELRRQEQAVHSELQSIVDHVQNRERYLRIAESLTDFLARLSSVAETMDIQERQRIVQLLVKEVLVGDDTIVIRHSIPLSQRPQGGDQGSPKTVDDDTKGESYLLRLCRDQSGVI